MNTNNVYYEGCSHVIKLFVFCNINIRIKNIVKKNWFNKFFYNNLKTHIYIYMSFDNQWTFHDQVFIELFMGTETLGVDHPATIKNLY